MHSDDYQIIRSCRTTHAGEVLSFSILPVIIYAWDCDVILPGCCHVLVKVSSVDLHVITELRHD